MANLKIVDKLREGRKAWNTWRRQNDTGCIDLKLSQLAGSRLAGFNLWGADFQMAKLSGADLSSANLFATNFYGADLRGAKLRNATLELSKCRSTTFVGADLTAANLHKTDFTSARLSRAILTNASCGLTTFADADLRDVIGLEMLVHRAASSVGIDTLLNSGGLPEVFLRGCGLPEEFIAYANSLVGKAIEYYSCFISYSSLDDEFARRLYADLQARNIRTWFAPEDLKIGDRFRARIDESIRVHDKLVLILSQQSIESEWVEREVEAAFEREDREKRDLLFPIRVDDAVFASVEAWACDIRRTRHIGDFANWKNHDEYARSFDRLVRDLKKTGPIRIA